MAESGESRGPLPEGLGAALAAAADPDGFVPFDRFMEVALYDPTAGYYARTATPFGDTGDFYTAARVSPLFAAAFAARVRAERERLGPGPTFHLVDWGPGDGTLLAGILEELAAQEVRGGGLEIDVVERSETLGRAAESRAAEPARRLGAALVRAPSIAALGPMRGLVIANELFDAQPVRRAVRTEDGWREQGIRLEGARPVAAVQEFRRPVGPTPLPEAAPPGTLFEWSPAAEALVREAADHLVEGTLLVDDYGLEEPEILAAHPRGTLQSIRRHREGVDPLRHPGESDLSTFVNLTRLKSAAARAGLWLRSDLRQAEALGAWGFPALLLAAIARCRSAEEEVRLRLAAKSLLFGFDRFRVLDFSAGKPAGSAGDGAT